MFVFFWAILKHPTKWVNCSPWLSSRQTLTQTKAFLKTLCLRVRMLNECRKTGNEFRVFSQTFLVQERRPRKLPSSKLGTHMSVLSHVTCHTHVNCSQDEQLSEEPRPLKQQSTMYWQAQWEMKPKKAQKTDPQLLPHDFYLLKTISKNYYSSED